MALIQYIVQPYDRWDSIAQKAYGEPHRWPEITAANPQVQLAAMPAPGTKLWVPIIELPKAADATAGLPSWRRP